MVWSPDAVAVEFRDVLQRYGFSMLLSILNTLLVRYTEVKYQLKQSFLHDY